MSKERSWVSFKKSLAQKALIFFNWTLTILLLLLFFFFFPKKKNKEGRVVEVREEEDSRMISLQFIEHQENYSKSWLLNLYSDLKDWRLEGQKLLLSLSVYSYSLVLNLNEWITEWILSTVNFLKNHRNRFKKLEILKKSFRLALGWWIRKIRCYF